MNNVDTLNLEVLESRLEMEALGSDTVKMWVPIECWCDNR